jgi:hypothetical protein
MLGPIYAKNILTLSSCLTSEPWLSIATNSSQYNFLLTIIFSTLPINALVYVWNLLCGHSTWVFIWKILLFCFFDPWNLISRIILIWYKDVWAVFCISYVVPGGGMKTYCIPLFFIPLDNSWINKFLIYQKWSAALSWAPTDDSYYSCGDFMSSEVLPVLSQSLALWPFIFWQLRQDYQDWCQKWHICYSST